ncbi:hypothetical protein CEY16_08650 [Halalkalibacillus sediminis]|uniref:Flagellar protein n=1 Tax=Halalkalibacillus sediminis TaxID=2018042 RepID=A0A2I0QV59_9BACI|nr:TIGR03826 family flagellar region protein [Halalkalibacillus sediminis]PKR77980.1 hypothetical protein CEY16_08650 [Halalkalibacillus sediminis]
MGELANCPECGTLFVKGAQTVCRDCYLEEEDKFQRVYEFLRKKKNRTATLNEVSEKTEVEEKLILKFMKQKRIHASSFPNLMYDCERCGNKIYEGKLCKNCIGEIQQDLDTEDQGQTIAEKEKSDTTGAYINVNKENRWSR